MNTGKKRSTLYLPDDLWDSLRDVAHQRRISMSQVVEAMLRKGLIGDDFAHSVHQNEQKE
jgi:predicted DNA-binding ribbon-helix-helix protein